MDETKLKAIKEFGVNRISLGVQSFCDNVLNFLGRGHTKTHSLKALEKTAGLFDNFSIDLIGGIPVNRNWDEEYHHLQQVNPPHISFYLLSIEENTAFYDSIKIDEEQQAREYSDFCRFTHKLGYKQYEVSNFCRQDYYSRHNMLYWEGRDYVGLGPSAVSFIKTQKIRIKNCSSLKKYIENPASYDIENLTDKDLFMETIFLSLRTDGGLNLSRLMEDYPVFREKIKENIHEMKKAGFLVENSGKITIPQKHKVIMNEIILKGIKEL